MSCPRRTRSLKNRKLCRRDCDSSSMDKPRTLTTLLRPLILIGLSRNSLAPSSQARRFQALYEFKDPARATPFIHLVAPCNALQCASSILKIHFYSELFTFFSFVPALIPALPYPLSTSSGFFLFLNDGIVI